MLHMENSLSEMRKAQSKTQKKPVSFYLIQHFLGSILTMIALFCMLHTLGKVVQRQELFLIDPLIHRNAANAWSIIGMRK